jgi:hypothetical protein
MPVKPAHSNLPEAENLVTSDEIRKVLLESGARDSDVGVMVLLAEYGSQAEVARRMNTYQGAVRHWAMRAVSHLQSDDSNDAHCRVRTACRTLLTLRTASTRGVWTDAEKRLEITSSEEEVARAVELATIIVGLEREAVAAQSGEEPPCPKCKGYVNQFSGGACRECNGVVPGTEPEEPQRWSAEEVEPQYTCGCPDLHEGQYEQYHDEGCEWQRYGAHHPRHFKISRSGRSSDHPWRRGPVYGEAFFVRVYVGWDWIGERLDFKEASAAGLARGISAVVHDGDGIDAYLKNFPVNYAIHEIHEQCVEMAIAQVLERLEEGSAANVAWTTTLETMAEAVRATHLAAHPPLVVPDLACDTDGPRWHRHDALMTLTPS